VLVRVEVLPVYESVRDELLRALLCRSSLETSFLKVASPFAATLREKARAQKVLRPIQNETAARK
jgi:hypothetical protein